MKELITFLILIFFGCASDSKKEDFIDSQDWICNEEKEIAKELLKKDTIQFILINEFPRFEKELNELLRTSNIQLQIIGSMHGEGYCQKAMMDSVINERFGLEFETNIKNKADSLFLDSRRYSIFPEQQLDKQPTLALNPNTNGQDEIIKRLNKKNLKGDSIELISNIVNVPYFVVKFNVSKDGISSNAEIIERNSTSDFIYLEEIIVNEINGLTDWSAGQIRNENVSSVIDIAIAVRKKYKRNAK